MSDFYRSGIPAREYLDIISEASFASGSSNKVITILIKYLEKQLGERIYLSDLPIGYENNYGKFSGYYCIVGNGDKAFRLNFKLGKSDSILSVDYYDKITSTPKFTIEFTSQDNSVNIATTIASVLQGNYNLEERASFSGKMFKSWLDSDEKLITDVLQKERLSAVYRDYFSKWIDDNDERPMSQPSFFNQAKAWLSDNNLRNNFAKSGTIKKASSEKSIPDKASKKKFDQQFALTVNDRFEMLEAQVMLVANNYMNSLLITGSPGIGKSYTVLDVLNKKGLEYHQQSGGIKSVKDLFRALYFHKDDEIIIFDDCDDVLTNKASQNILKAILDSNPNKPNEVTYLDKDFKDPSEIEKMTPRQKEKAIPNKFTFTSGIIFISNLPERKFDTAVLSRSARVDLSLTKEEIINRIEDKIDNFPPDIPASKKIEVLEFIREYQGMIKRIDFRTFERVAVQAMTGHPKWQAWAMHNIG